MATATTIAELVARKLADIGTETAFHDGHNGGIFTTFANQDVVAEGDAPHIHLAGHYHNAYGQGFNNPDGRATTVGIGHEVQAAAIWGSETGSLNVQGGGSSAAILVDGSPYNDVIVAGQNPAFISPGMTVASMYTILRKGETDADGNVVLAPLDDAGMNFWQAQIDAGVSLNQVAQGFLPYIDGHDTLDNAAFVTMLYENVLNRAPDQGGFNYSVNMLENFAANGASVAEARANLLITFANSQEYLVGNDVGRAILEWENAAEGRSVGMSLNTFAGHGDDVIYAALGNNYINGGEGADTVYLSGYNFGSTTIDGVRGYDNVIFQNDNPAVRVTQVGINEFEGGVYEVTLKTNWDSDVKIITDEFSAHAVAQSFGLSLADAAGAQFNGAWTVGQINGLLDFNSDIRPTLTPTSVDAPAIEGSDDADAIFGTGFDQTFRTYDGNDEVSTGNGNNMVETGGGNDKVWTGAGNNYVIDYWGQNQISFGEGNNVAAFGAGTDVWFQKGGIDLSVFNFAAGNEGERGVINGFDVNDTLAFAGLRADDIVTVKVFNESDSFDLSVYGKTLTVFTDQSVIDTLVKNLNNGKMIPAKGVLEVEMEGADLQALFGWSVNNTERAPDVVYIDDEGFYQHETGAGWNAHQNNFSELTYGL